MEIKAITEALRWLRQEQHKRVVIVTDSMSTLQKVQKEFLYADWIDIILKGPFERVTWIFSPGHAGVVGNERADVLAASATIDNNLTLDPSTVLQYVQEHLALSRPQDSSYTLTLLKEKGVQAGEGANDTSRGATRRRQNQLLFETISLPTLRWSLQTRSERAWVCPACTDLDVEDRY